MVLAVLGARVGLLLALEFDLLVSLKPANLPRLAEIGLDRTVFIFTLGLSVLTGIVFGLVPAWHASKSDLNEGLKDSSRGATGGRGGSRWRVARGLGGRAFAVLLVGAGS